MPPTSEQPAPDWERVHRRSAYEELSWYQRDPAVSLELVDLLAVAPDEAVVDVGGGSSPLVDRLLDRGHAEPTVLDVTGSAFAAARDRLGARAEAVNWLVRDVRDWRPRRRYGLWHDRALLHFLVAPADRARYVESLRRAVTPGGAVVIATFAPDGPATCSGLPVLRYDADGIAAALGPGAELVAARREEHVTPAGRVQPFTWAALRLRG